MPRIFDPQDSLDMATAADGFSRLLFTSARLLNVAIEIATIDDPYFSRLNGRTYMAAARLASPSEILALAKQHDGFAVEKLPAGVVLWDDGITRRESQPA